MKDIKMIKKKNIIFVSAIIIAIVVIALSLFTKVFDNKTSYGLPTDANVMQTFPAEITGQKENILAVYFINDTQENIDNRYNAATIKVDLTYNSQGSVKGWLEPTTSDSSKYTLYVGSEGKTYLSTGYDLFREWINVKVIDFSNADTSEVTTMEGMFYECASLTSLDLSNFDTSKVTNMSWMFAGYDNTMAFTSLNLSSFDTSNVTSMEGMFYECARLTSLDLSNFDTSKVTNMSSMFEDCSSLTSLDVSSFDTSQVTTMEGMFLDCEGLKSIDLSNFNTSKVTDMSAMFSSCLELIDLNISSFDTSNVTDTGYMFVYCNNLASLDLSNFDTSQVTIMRRMFAGCGHLTDLDISSFDISNVNDYDEVFLDIPGDTEILVKDAETKTWVLDKRSDLTNVKIKNEGVTPEKSSVNTLKTLTLSNGTISFNPNTTSYDVSVSNNISSITISSTLTDSKSNYVDGYGNRIVDLNVGINTILLKVEAENGSVRTYTLNVTREDIQNVNLVSDIEIKGYDINFSNNVKEYNLKINDEKSLEINVLLTNNNYSYEINGNENLSNGKVITIKVNSNNKVEEYKINITTSTTNIEVPSTSSNLPHIIMISSLVFAFIGVGIIYLNRKISKSIDKN